MEINTEINKVFGQEMAKLFAAQISEEEMLQKARDIWKQLNESERNFWNGGTKPSEIDKLIASQIRENVAKEVATLTETEKFKEECKQMAIEMVNDIREQTRVKVIEEVSSRLAGMSVGGYGCGLRGMIEDVIMETLGRR